MSDFPQGGEFMDRPNPPPEADEIPIRRTGRRCAQCHGRAVQLHHVLYRQHVPRELLHDSRNLLPLCVDCHANHHGIHSLSLRLLTDANYEFAREVKGAAAYDYLRKRYGGDDPRLEALLDA